MKLKNLFFIGAVFCGLFVGLNSSSAQSWTQTSAPENFVWKGLAASADGSKLAACAYYGGSNFEDGSIYVSTNAGQTWFRSGAPLNNWQDIASSTNGNKLVAVDTYGGIYVSTNAGTSWVQTTNSQQTYWVAVASSGDGVKLVAVADGLNKKLFTSSDSGKTWNANTLPLNQYWISIASSMDGTKLILASNGNTNGLGGAIYTSSDSGLTWKSNNVPLQYWYSAASSADGSMLGAISAGDTVYLSKNSGANWTGKSLPVSGFWTSIACSADGSKWVAVASGGRICTSQDYGETWQRNTAPNALYQTVASSADATVLISSVAGGGVYLSRTGPSLNVSQANNNIVLSWPWPAAGFNLQHNTNLATSGWSAVTNQPQFGNWQYQLVLPRTNVSDFFRLTSP